MRRKNSGLFNFFSGITAGALILAVVVGVLAIIPLIMWGVWSWAIMPIHPIFPAIGFFQWVGICIGTVVFTSLFNINVKFTKNT